MDKDRRDRLLALTDRAEETGNVEIAAFVREVLGGRLTRSVVISKEAILSAMTQSLIDVMLSKGGIDPACGYCARTTMNGRAVEVRQDFEWQLVQISPPPGTPLQMPIEYMVRTP